MYDEFYKQREMLLDEYEDAEERGDREEMERTANEITMIDAWYTIDLF